MGILPDDVEILPPYDDRLFKAMLIKPEAKPTLLFLAPQIVKRPVVNVMVRNSELAIDNIEEKAECFDLNCMVDDDSQADIEMQGSRMKIVAQMKIFRLLRFFFNNISCLPT